MNSDTNRNKFKLSAFLEGTAESIDISDSLYQKAEARYKSIGNWLEREESGVNKFKPHIYPQGSFALGTVVKPFNDADQYDIDLVCVLALSKKQLSQKQLKQLIGKEIFAYVKSNSMTNPAEEGRRCWTLNYAEGAQFHMDILPAIPDGNSLQILLESRKMSNEWAQNAIAITDKTEIAYDQLTGEWPRSNPKGYLLWFKDRIKIQYDKRRILLAESVKGKIEDVPEYRIKTPLQISIKLLKRHRDIMFKNDRDDKPISIIITTLAAKAYNNEDNVADAIANIVTNMKNYIENRVGVYWVVNPVNPFENFADKWVEYPQRKQNFFRWLLQVEKDFIMDNKQMSNTQLVANKLEPFWVLEL